VRRAIPTFRLSSLRAGPAGRGRGPYAARARTWGLWLTTLPQVGRLLGASAIVATSVLLTSVHAGAQETTSTVAPPTTAESGIVVSGVLELDARPVAGVRVTASRGSTEVARVSSNADGAWKLVVPAPGTYRLRLDTSTLP